MNLVIRIAVEVIGKKADRLHVGEQSPSVGKHLGFQWGKKILGRFHISASVCLENIHIYTDVIQIFVVFGTRIASRPDEIADIGKYKAGHYRIQINNTKHFTFFVE